MTRCTSRSGSRPPSYGAAWARHRAPTAQPEAAAEHATCTGCEADADADTAEFAGEFEDASAWEDAAGHSRWGLYDQLALGWGQAEAGND